MAKKLTSKKGSQKMGCTQSAASLESVRMRSDSKLLHKVGNKQSAHYIRPQVMSSLAVSQQKLKGSYYYLSRDNMDNMKSAVKYPQHLVPYLRVLNRDPSLMGLWISHRAVSAAAGYDTQRVDAAEEKYGFFLWAPEFENYHQSMWDYVEKGFYAHGAHWRGPEQYFQFHKLKKCWQTDKLRKEVANMTESAAYEWGRALAQDQFVGSKEWDNIRVAVMQRAVNLKFRDKQLRKLLNSSAGSPLVSVKGDFWGFPGQNMLGQLLMQCRDETVSVCEDCE